MTFPEKQPPVFVATEESESNETLNEPTHEIMALIALRKLNL